VKGRKRRGCRCARAVNPTCPPQSGTLEAKIHTPLDTSRLGDFASVPKDNKPVVLLACGSYSPPTVMHVRIFETARDYFKSMNGALPSPPLPHLHLHLHLHLHKISNACHYAYDHMRPKTLPLETTIQDWVEKKNLKRRAPNTLWRYSRSKWLGASS